MNISPDILPALRPLAAYSVRELRQVAMTVTRLVPTVTVADQTLQLQQLRMHPAPANASGEPHSHSCYEAILVLAGEVVYPQCDPAHLCAGDVCLHPPTLPHAWQTTSAPCLRLVCWFASDAPLALSASPVASCPDLLTDVQLLAHEVTATPPGWTVRVPLRLATLLSRYLTLTQAPALLPSPPTADEEILVTIDGFVRDNVSAPLTLTSIATHLGMSERSLERTYRRLTGRTLWTAVQQLRMEGAAELLIDTDLSITEIAARVGLPEVAYFCARFRHFAHLTPGQYRAQARMEPCRRGDQPAGSARRGDSW
jgi:AraC-like DNA-binding protein